MAETVLSMAKSTLGGAISVAASAAAVEMSLLMGVRKDIWFIKDELKTIQAFLDVAGATKKKDVLLKVWVEQVRDVSYSIEDCLAEFMVHVRSQSLSQQLMKLKDRHQIAIQIRDLKSRVEEVSSRNTRYSLIKTDGSSTIDEVDTYAEDVRNHSAANIDEATLVGFEGPKKKLIELVDVNTKHERVKVISVVGMGGLGKTALARKVYEDIVKNFSCCAWITVSPSFSKIEMLKDMIKQCFDHKDSRERNNVQELANILTTKLTDKRYFIVLDDLWTIDHWKWIHTIAFPTNNIKGSRIIVTTRDVELARQITDESLIYHLKPLESVDATNLLLRKSRKKREDMEKDENLKNLVELLVKKSGSLPLALLTIGGILATKKVAEWRQFYHQLPSELETNPSLEAMRRIVTLSYNHLPSHLKSCYLYLSIFPEDFEIGRRRLVERWIAEGFVRARSGVNVEDVGKSYFNELINRSMIQASKVGIEGSIKSCRVHDIMRDVIVSISRDENFVCLLGDSVNSSSEDNYRHVTYHGGKYQRIYIDWSHVRSLTMFGVRSMEPISHAICLTDFRMLRALDLAVANLRTQKEGISNIGLLRHLKYVNVTAFWGLAHFSSNYKLPRSIGKLQGLQFLHADGICSKMLPTDISELRSLRSLRCTTPNHIYHYPEDRRGFRTRSFRKGLFTRALRHLPLIINPIERSSTQGGVGIPRGISNLNELQVLKVLHIKQTSSKAIEELGKLTQLRKLGVVTGGASEKKYRIFCAAIEKLSSLSSLTVDSVSWNSQGQITDEGLDWLSISFPPDHLLRSLELRGCLAEMPQWVGSLAHLVKLKLERSQLKEADQIQIILGKLPNLMLLHLGWNSYVGEKLVFRTEAFPKLRKLDIHVLDKLRRIKFKEGTSPQMEKIQISHCILQSGIIGISNLPSLNQLYLDYECRVARFHELEKEAGTHRNHPVLRLREDRSYHGLEFAATTEGSTPLPEAAPAATEESSLQVEVESYPMQSILQACRDWFDEYI